MDMKKNKQHARLVRCWEDGSWDNEIIEVPARLDWAKAEAYIAKNVATQAFYHRCLHLFLVGLGAEVMEGL
jgi:hypothetical protein